MRGFGGTIYVRGITTGGLENNTQVFVHNRTELCVADQCTILITPELAQWETLYSNMTEEEEAKTNGRTFLLTWGESEIV